MINLPYLVLNKIFSFFELEEQFKLRIVCKLWKNLIEFEAKNQPNLLVYYDFYGYVYDYNCPHLIHKNKNRVNQKFFQHFCLIENYFPNVKNLILFYIYINKINELHLLKLKSYLINLEELSIYSYYGNGTNDYFLNDFLNIKNLNFTKLKRCHFGDIILHDNFSLNAPNLVEFSFWTHFASFPHKISFKYDQFKTIKCQYPNYFNRKFINLENLICPFIDQNFDLLNYPKLKKLDFCPRANEMSLIEKLFKQKKEYKFNDLEIVAYGFKISKIDENLKELLSFVSMEINSLLYIQFKPNIKLNSFLKFIEKNQLNLSNDYLNWPFHLECQYIKFNKLFITYFLTKNLIYIRIKNLNTSENLKNLIYFLTGIGGIQKLSLYECKIRKEVKFLFKKVPFISALELYKCDVEQNLEFLSEINNLLDVTVWRIIYPIEDYFNIFDNYKLRYLKIFSDLFPNIEFLKRQVSVGHKKFDNSNDALLFLKSNYINKR